MYSLLVWNWRFYILHSSVNQFIFIILAYKQENLNITTNFSKYWIFNPLEARFRVDSLWSNFTKLIFLNIRTFFGGKTIIILGKTVIFKNKDHPNNILFKLYVYRWHMDYVLYFFWNKLGSKQINKYTFEWLSVGFVAGWFSVNKDSELKITLEMTNKI